MKTVEIEKLIDLINQSGLQEVNIETEEFKLHIKRQFGSVQGAIFPPHVTSSTFPPSGTPIQEISTAPSAAGDLDRYITIKSSMIGTFYRAPNPDAPPFVKEGDQIKEGSHLCVIEAMKLYNEIEAEVSGKVVEILVEDGSPVDYDQPLFIIDPSS